MNGGTRAGVVCMVLGIASLSCMDALGKRVAAHYSVFEMLAIRSTVALGALVFGNIPAPSFWVGAAIIVGAGAYTVTMRP